MKEPTTPNRRKHTRYKPKEGVIAEISLSGQKDPFAPDLVGLVFSESYDGCGLVLLQSNALQSGMQCVIKVGNLSPLDAEIVWRTEIDPQVIKIGLRFLE